MLNIGRMGPGSHDYYLNEVAAGLEDYYLGRGEAPGRWLGHGLDDVGLEAGSLVSREQLQAVLAGQHPDSGEQLARHPARQVPGFDLTFRAPKSVSMVWALADTPTATAVQRAHDDAVDAAIGYLQREAGRSRRGAQGVEQVDIDGFISAAFRHRTSRAGDPLLHTHVLTANLARTTDDGVWRTLDSRLLFTHARTAGFLYQAHLRDALTRELGVGWQPIVNGTADIVGVERSWIDVFSKRQQAIVKLMAERGEDSARAAQVATLATRQAKGDPVDEPTLRQAWKNEARDAGIPDGWTDRVIGVDQQRPVRITDLAARVTAADGLTEHASTFTRRDAVRAIAEALPQGATVEQVEHLTDHILNTQLDSGAVVRLGGTRGHLTAVIRRGDGVTVDAEGGAARFTTAELMAIEGQAIGAATTATSQTVVPELAIRRALAASPSLSHEQATMVRRLAASGAGVEVVVGKAGTGKTYALNVARKAWEQAGFTVTGTALAARAATELEDSAGIRSTTLARLLTQLDAQEHGGPGPWRPGRHVLVVDEAGMIGTRQLATLLAHAQQRRVKVVLVGDPHQLPEINAGGLFRALATRLPAVELHDNRRQHEPWERDALDQLRDGNVPDAIAAYQAHGRIHAADTADGAREQLVSDWWQAFRDEPGRAVMIGLRRAEVDDLNRRAREHLTAAGSLTGPTHWTDADAPLQAGDRIVCLRNDRQLDVVNGLQADVTGIERDGLHIATDDGRHLALDWEYVQKHVTHGYAITGHKAQGLTVDHTFVYGSDTLYREWGYVALSRGRQSNRLYLHDLDDLLDGGPHTREQHDPIVRAARQLERSQAEPPLTDTPGARLREADAFLRTPQVRARREMHTRRNQLVSDLNWARTLHQRAAEAVVGSRPGITRRARNEHAQLQDKVAATSDQAAQLADQLDRLDLQLAELPTVGTIKAAQDAVRQAFHDIRQLADRRVSVAMHSPPQYLTVILGAVPDGRADRERWRQAAGHIERHRAQWDITNPLVALGAATTDADHARAAQSVQQEVDRLLRPRDRNLSRSRSLTR